MSLKNYIKLTRPANILTAHADILTGIAISGVLAINQWKFLYLNTQLTTKIFFLLLSTTFLYAGGIVLNDFFDAKQDAIERPERVIPSKKVSPLNALIFSLMLFSSGIAVAFQASTYSGFIATSIAILCFSYDSKIKHYAFLGPVNMGLCRGLNLLLGISIITICNSNLCLIVSINTIYIIAVTLISKSEVIGMDRTILKKAFIIYIAVIILLLSQSILKNFHIVHSLPFILLFIYCSFKPLIMAIREPTAKMVQKTVKAGVLSLVILDSALTAGYSEILFGLIILTLLPISMFLSRFFPVT